MARDWQETYPAPASISLNSSFSLNPMVLLGSHFERESMKPATIYFFVLIGINYSCQQVDEQKIDVYARPVKAERSSDYDAIHYRVKLRFDEDTKSFWGENKITLSPLNDDFSTCTVDAETYVVTSVVDEDSQDLSFEHNNGKLVVQLANAYAATDTLSFTVFYDYNEGRDKSTDPEVEKIRETGIQFHAESRNSPSLITTLSWPLGAHHWFPCYDHPNDKVTNEFIVTVRDDYNVLANGRLVSVTEDESNGTKTFHWSQELPHSTYLHGMTIGPYEVIQDALGDLPINYWVYPEDVNDARRSFGRTPEIIAFFNEEYGYDYPWAKYDQITVPDIGGGAEATSATEIGQGNIHDARADQDYPSHWLVAHEAAHQWWGNMVTMRDWSHAWISESFATYGEYRYSRHDLGEDDGAVNLLGKKNSYLREANTRYIRPIVFDRWNDPGDLFDSHLYPKGAAVLNMMRYVLGDEAFSRAMTQFLQEYAFKIADTDDLIRVINESTGKNIDWFYDQWLFSPGHPIFDVSYTWNESTKKVELRIIQTQDTEKKVPIFKAPVKIAIVMSGGTTIEELWIENKDEHFELDAQEKPLLVRFDEGNYLLKEWTFNKSVDELLFQLKNDDVIGRGWAATELGKISGNADVETALMKSALDDPFWYVRQQAIAAISVFNKEEHTSFLKDKSLDENTKVRAEALKALGNLQNRDLVDFLKERFELDNSYRAQAEAVRAIGKLQDAGELEFFQEVAEMKSPRNVLKNAAKQALERISN